MSFSIAGCMGSTPDASMRPKIATFRARSTDVTEILGIKGVLPAWGCKVGNSGVLCTSVELTGSSQYNEWSVRENSAHIFAASHRLMLHSWRLTYVTVEARFNVLSF